MSGGSYNFLCDRMNASDCAPLLHDLRRMRRQLETYGECGRDARQDFDFLIACLDMASHMARRLSNIAHDVEWHESCDYSEDQVRQALMAYRSAAGQTGG